MKKILLGISVIALLFSTSCKEQIDEIEDQAVDVSFTINNLSLKGAANKGELRKDGFTKAIVCSDADPAYVKATIGSKEYTLKLINLPGDTQTEVIKLPAGNYSLSSFVVYDKDDNAIWAAPMDNSFYAQQWNLVGMSMNFTIDKFNKKKLNVDVLCYEPAQYEEFGFAWFEFAKIKVKTVCFYGDVCTKFYEDFHKAGSPYEGQTYDGYDFPAIFEVVITDSAGNELNRANNTDTKGVGDPLCLDYPDYESLENEEYNFAINLYMPNSTNPVNIYNGTFTDQQWADKGNDQGFGGTDGIFDFVVGNCSYDGNDADIELPAYIPVPKTVSYEVSNEWGNGESYLDIEFKNLAPTGTYIIEAGVKYPSFCGDKLNYITPGTWYDNAGVFSSLDKENLPDSYKNYNWGSLNWIANNMDGYTPKQVQNAIWEVIHHTEYGDDGGLTAEALTHDGFVPTVGDYAIVLFDANNGNGDDIQLQIVRIDP